MSATRLINGTELPIAGSWVIDPGHADVGFVGRHFGLTNVRGRFTGISGTVILGADPVDSSVDAVIEMATVSSGDPSRDDHLRSGEFFDVDHHPTATYRSTRVEVNSTAETVHGDLTIKGIARPVVLAVDDVGHAADPWGNDRAVFSATARLNREDWGLTWNMVLEAGGLLVSKEITLEIEVELIHQPE